MYSLQQKKFDEIYSWVRYVHVCVLSLNFCLVWDYCYWPMVAHLYSCRFTPGQAPPRPLFPGGAAVSTQRVYVCMWLCMYICAFMQVYVYNVHDYFVQVCVCVCVCIRCTASCQIFCCFTFILSQSVVQEHLVPFNLPPSLHPLPPVAPLNQCSLPTNSSPPASLVIQAVWPVLVEFLEVLQPLLWHLPCQRLTGDRRRRYHLLVPAVSSCTLRMISPW